MFNIDLSALANLGIDPSIFAQAQQAQAPAPVKAATTPEYTPPPTAYTTAPAAAPAAPTVYTPTAADVQAYGASNPDLKASWDSGGVMRQLGSTYEQALAAHLSQTGLKEMAAGTRNAIPGLAAQVPTAGGAAPSSYLAEQGRLAEIQGSEAAPGMQWITDPNGDIRLVMAAPGSEYTDSMGNRYKVGSDQVTTPYGARTAAQAAALASAQTGKVNLLDPNYKMPSAAEIAANPDLKPMATFGIDPALLPKAASPSPSPSSGKPAAPATSALPPGLQFADPSLQPANDQYATPYYAAYTNDNDFAGAVMAAPGQKIRMVDAKTGEVVYEGVGQEGAKKATELANAVSKEKGRKAAWQIQIDQNGQWTTAAAERYDPKKKGLFGSLMDIVLPIAGAILLPGVGGALAGSLGAGLGAAGGSAISSAAQGRSIGDTLKMAALSGIGAGVVAPAAGKALSGLGTKLGLGANVSIIPGSDQLISASIPDAITGVAAPGWVEGLTSAVPSLGGSAGSAALGNLVSELVVQGVPAAAAPSLAAQILTAGGAGLGALAGGSLADGNTVSELVVEPAKPVSQAPVVGAALPGVVSGLTQAPNPTNLQTGSGSITDKAKDGLAALGLDLKDLLGLGLVLGGSLGAGGAQQPTGTGLNIGNANVAAAGTPASLSSIFRAQLPAATFGGKTPRQMSMSPSGWKSYAMGPEQSFFSSVPERPSGITGLAANIAKLSDAEVGDRNGDGRIDSIDRMLLAAAIGG